MDVEYKSKKILVINTGSKKKKFILERLNQLGYEVFVLHREKNWAQRLAKFIIAETNDQEASILAVERFCKRTNTYFDGIVTFWDDNIILTSKIANKLGLTGVDSSIAKKIHRKDSFRKICKDNKISYAKFCSVSSEKKLEKTSKEIGFPCVIKPRCGAGSAFLRKAENLNELKQAFRWIKNSTKDHYESSEWDDLNILVEEFLDGYEVDLDLVVQNKKVLFWSITDNFPATDKFFMETGDAIPSILSSKHQKKLVKLAEEIIYKLNLSNGVFHFEAKLEKKGWVPIEFNLRMGGDYVYNMIKECWGVDMVEASACIACGMKFTPNPYKKPKKYLRGGYWIPEKSGKLTNLKVDLLPDSQNFIESFHVESNESEIKIPPEGFDFVGWALVSGSSHKECKERLQKVMSEVSFEIDDRMEINILSRFFMKVNKMANFCVEKFSLLF